MLNRFDIDAVILTALREDMPSGDITTDNLIKDGSTSHALFIAGQDGIIAGLDVAERVFTLLDQGISFKRKVEDGAFVINGDTIAEIDGDTKAMLKGERTSLNFLQRLSGVATKTNEFCKKVKGLPVKIADTRKTTPGLRYLEKYAVKVGGGSNHRFSLSDGVLIKDNHIKAMGGVGKAIDLIRGRIPHTVKIEVETETLEQVKEALKAKADIIMLDNMNLKTMKEAVDLINHKAIVEASGDIDQNLLYDVACTGVDIISIGRITRCVNSFDISMKFV